MEKMPLATQTLYAELVEQLMVYETERSIGHLSGSFVSKTIKNRTYYYFQYADPGGSHRQIYLGRAEPHLSKILQRFELEKKSAAADKQNIEILCAQLRSGGALSTDHASARVLRALADAGVFKWRGVLVGTHAYNVLGNMLGYAWESAALKTQDIDIAASAVLEVALPEDSADLPKVLESLKIGFLPVPPLNPKSPSTAFKVRGRELRVDLLTPALRHQQKPVLIPRWKAAAQPLAYLDYLIEDCAPGAVINGGGILVRVPNPARFALHKLIISQERGFAFQTKSHKDLHQAAQILSVLIEERPADLKIAWTDLKARGASWVKKAKVGMKQLEKYVVFKQLQKFLSK